LRVGTAAQRLDLLPKLPPFGAFALGQLVQRVRVTEPCQIRVMLPVHELFAQGEA
jgi:hypothetical protein